MANAHDLLMAQRAAMMEKSGYTAKDYVQNGLIAMWDGIENVGYAADGYQHSADSKTWVNLAGGANITVNSHGSFLSDHLITDGVYAGAYASIANLDDSYTFELCYALAENPKAGVLVNIKNTGRINMFAIGRGGRVCRSYGRFNSIAQSSPSTVAWSNEKSVLNGDYEQSALDLCDFSAAGTFAIGARTTTSSTGAIKVMAYCIRIYNRELIQGELSANYAIDKARFGLT